VARPSLQSAHGVRCLSLIGSPTTYFEVCLEAPLATVYMKRSVTCSHRLCAYYDIRTM